MKALRYAIRLAIGFVKRAPWEGYILSPFGFPESFMVDDSPRPASDSNELEADGIMDEWVRANAGTTAHPAGTCALSKLGADYGCVDLDFRVKGVKGVRVVDASVFVSTLSFFVCEVYCFERGFWCLREGFFLEKLMVFLRSRGFRERIRRRQCMLLRRRPRRSLR